MTALPHRQRGVALLVALLVVALAVILVAALLDRGELALARTRNTLRAEQAQAYAQGLELYAAQALLTTTLRDGPDTNASPWALPLPPQPVPGGLISGALRERNGCFNLNNLQPGEAASAEWRGVFERLLGHLGLDPSLATAVQGWLGADANGAEANWYLAQPVPYRPRRGAFAHVSELRLVRGMTGATYARLAPHVCALPAGTRLNVNTASVPLLQSLGTFTQAQAQALWNDGQARYADTAAFAQAAGAGLTVPLALLDVYSHYFLARGDIVLDGVPFTFHSLIEKVPGRPLRVIERSRGADEGATD
ncbi:MAG: type II secretion system minor pseudopilin GspK [Rhodanobacteraceae bacterium]|jgi:general secretion pathway protein K|nr:type II secretion system minor pseudopilin GspK [Rhodanobacteraceae bacterium]